MIQNLKGKTILFFCPRFFCYESEIQNSLERLGAKVIWFDDRPSNNFYSKAVIRVNKNFLKRKISAYYAEILSNVREYDFDYLFFVNPEAISVDSLCKLQHTFPKAKSVLYMWDSFKNRKQNLQLLPLFDYKYTFDPEDAKSLGLSFRPLFFTKAYEGNSGLAVKYDLLFIGTAHSDRYTFVKKIAEFARLKKNKLYFYLSSKLLFLYKTIFDRSFKSVKLKDISFHSLGHQEIASLMRESAVILDINHPNQIGLTMRTFETLGSHRKLITTNKDILNYDFYHKSNVMVIDRENPHLDSLFFEIPFQDVDEEILFKYSIDGWAKEIFQFV